jgi:hypothetical protein
MMSQFGYVGEPREIDRAIMRYVVNRVISLQYGLLLECNLFHYSSYNIPARSLMASVSIFMSRRLTQCQMHVASWHFCWSG